MGDSTFVWKADQVISLIKTRTALNYLFTGKKGSSRNGWDMVAAQLRIGASPLQCKKKFENLQTKYKSIMIPPTGDGLEEQPHGAQGWPFFDEMHKFMSSRRTINPLLLVESYPIQSYSSTVGDNQTSQNKRLRPLPSCTCTSPVIEDSTLTEVELSQPPASGISQYPQTSTCSSSSFRPSPSSTPLTLQQSVSGNVNSVQPPQFSPTSSTSLTSSPSCSSWECNIEDEIDEPIERPTKKRRSTPSSNNSISELVALIKEDLQNQERQREEARKVELDLLDVLKDFLSKK